MKICLVSDTHGNREILNDIYNANPNCNIYLHLGDSELPEDLIYPFISVKGNCDYFLDYPTHKIIKTPYCNIYCEHGHIHGRGSVDLLKRNDCKIYLYGHTHIQRVEKVEDYYFINPGSVTRPRDGSNGTYMVLELSKDKFEYKVIEL